MQYFTIAGLQASRLGFGCAAIGGYDYGPVDDAQSLRAIAAALDCGITFFDVADIYGLGHAEEILARGLAEKRHDVVIATKGGVRWDPANRTTCRDITPAYLRTAIDRSLARLRVERIPLYQLHWPDGATPLEAALAELEAAKAAGKIGEYGICNCDPDLLLNIGAEPARLASIQMPFSLIERRWEASLTASVARGVRSLAYNILCHGLLSGKYRQDSTFHGPDLRNRLDAIYGDDQKRIWVALRELQEVAGAAGLKAAQVAVNWAYSHPAVSCALVGIRTAEQIRELTPASGFALPPAISSRLNEIFTVARST